MKLSIKNLKGEVFQVQLHCTDTVTHLKAKIQQAKNIPADSLKIVYKGKTINNEDTIEKIGIKETDFLVVMSQIQKPQPKPKEDVKVQAPISDQLEKEEKKEISAQIIQEKKEVLKPSIPQVNQADITDLMSMGFPRVKCIEALRAASNNIERAVQYLLNGIPANLKQKSLEKEPQQVAEPVRGDRHQLGIAQLETLFNNPQFAHIRDVIRQNPLALQPILVQISQTSPQLFNLISQFPNEFQRIISGGGHEGEAQEDQQDQPEQHPETIKISQADVQSINRLRQLGFSKIESAQAFFACEKNDDMAANLLFDRFANGDIEMEPQIPPLTTGNQGENSAKKSGQKNEDDEDNLFN